MEIPRILSHSPFFVPSKDGLTQEQYDREHAQYLARKDLNPIQKMNGLTLGGFVASVLGIVLTIFSEKAGRTIGALLTLVGLGSVAGGFYKADELNNGGGPDVAPPSDEVVTPPASGEATKSKKKKPKKENDDLPNDVDELIAIVKNEVEGKDYKSPERIKAAKIIARKKLEEIQEATKQLVEWLKNNLSTPRIKRVIDAVRSTLHNIGDKAVGVLLEPTSSIKDLAKNILDEIKKVIKIKHPKPTI